MSNLAYLYNSDTFQYIGCMEMTLDKRHFQNTGIKKYFCPANATTKVPPDPEANKIIQFNIFAGCWELVDNFIGQNVIDKSTKIISQVKSIGPIPENLTLNIPSADKVKYLVWSEEISDWVVSEDGRKLLLDDIWKVRKANRDAMCNSDIEYNGHMIHVDEVSFKDILLAAQEASIAPANFPKRWITADSTEVMLEAVDFIAILTAYGARRQQLVYTSNEAWANDTTLTNEQLFNLLAELKNS